MKRAREEVESVPPPQKRTRQEIEERDSGYESDSRSSATTPLAALPLPSPHDTYAQ